MYGKHKKNSMERAGAYVIGVTLYGVRMLRELVRQVLVEFA